MKRIIIIFTIFSSASCFAQQGNCLNVPVAITGDTKEITVGNAMPSTSTANEYVYYHKRRAGHCGSEFADLNDSHASKPILLRTSKTMQSTPQSYNVTLSTPQDHVTACPDSTLNVQADINVEQQSEYTGNYPAASSSNDYKLVSRRVYMKTARKMCRAERKERRVSRLTGVPVQQL